MALGHRLTSVRGNRGKDCEKWTAGSPKNIERKKKYILLGVILLDLGSCILPVFQTLEVLDS
jgi:hypothetical protein